MPEPDVQALFRAAVHGDDADAMRRGVEGLLGLGDGATLSPEREHALRRPDFVMEMPQSGERVRGRDAMRELQERFPGGGPSLVLRRVVGAGHVWVVEGYADYGNDPWHVMVVFEIDDDGLVARETRYYAGAIEAPGWRADLVEQM